MRIAVVHNAVTDGGGPDEVDVLTQAAAVQEALDLLGHAPSRMACDLDLSGMLRRLQDASPDLVFNLVEGLAGHGQLIHLFPSLLQASGIRFAGSGAEALFLTSNKVLAKERMTAAGLPTPGWVGPCTGRRLEGGSPGPNGRPDARWIVKSVWEHASIGLDDDAVVAGRGPEEIGGILAPRARRLGGACFAERFVEGREFNLSLLETPSGVRVLPPAEIRFEGFEAGRPRIVGYRAKWEADSFEYRHTPRTFDLEAADRPLLKRLEGLAHDCWRLFSLKGWARVDFRVDAEGGAWILEVNANPCLSPDAGFAAALEQAGLTFPEALDGILASV